MQSTKTEMLTAIGPIAILVLTFSMITTTGSATAQSDGKMKAAAKVPGDAYPLNVCAVTGKKLGSMGKPVVYVHEGRQIRFCCAMCIGEFKSDPARYLKKIDALIVKQQKPFYPLATCVVKGGPLKGAAGKPVDHVYKNRLVRFCCPKCVRTFNGNPAAYLKKLDAAVIKKQLASYPLDKCVVAGGKLGGMGEPYNYVHANRLVRFCCKGCIGSFRKDPLKFVAMIDRKMKSKSGGAGHEGGKGNPSGKQEG